MHLENELFENVNVRRTPTIITLSNEHTQNRLGQCQLIMEGKANLFGEIKHPQMLLLQTNLIFVGGTLHKNRIGRNFVKVD